MVTIILSPIIIGVFHIFLPVLIEIIIEYPVIVAATMTKVFAFFPLIFWPEIMGEFMSYLPIILIITLSYSLFVALIINPTLESFL